MADFFKAEQISENVFFVGARDWNVRNFHGYATQKGSTYNAFLIIDEHVTLIDTVKGHFVEEMMARIASVIDPEKIDYIISNHSEPDHSGALKEVIERVKPSRIIASQIGSKTLKAYYGIDTEVVKTGDSICLGKSTLSFVDTKMLHWPDSMVSYLDTDKVLFSQDAFGMHLAGSKLWADEYDKSILDYEARKYFTNIINLQAPKVLDLLKTLPSLKLDIQIIAPHHNPL
jgi:flavorubredoxin